MIEQLPAITKFDGNYRFLSNFWSATVELDGMFFRNVEAAYQAAKTLDMKLRDGFQPMTGSEAKREGKRIPIRPDWDEVKLGVMEHLLRQKFPSRHTRLAQQLLATGNAPLIEGNTWGDTFWGICRGKGSNHLGRLLMQIRDELRAGQAPVTAPRTAAPTSRFRSCGFSR